VERWAVILAGGDGLRLRPLTRAIAGDERPKQFCRLLGDETLLEATLRRAGRSVPASRTAVVLTRIHAPYYEPLLAGRPVGLVVVQPLNRGTAPAILYAVHRVARRAPLGALALLPSDHYVSDDAAFMAHVETAFAAVAARPELIVLLGFTPTAPETDYGWIEPAGPIQPAPPAPLLRVGAFWEKPRREAAEALLRRGALWNGFVIIARIPALLGAMRQAVPDLVEAFEAVRPALGTPGEAAAVARLYAGLRPLNFSSEVLERRPANLAVLPVRDVEWSDWGDPGRVLATLRRLGAEPAWVPAAGGVPA
jgi:mannose-1-phosphate guanylyltransferase